MALLIRILKKSFLHAKKLKESYFIYQIFLGRRALLDNRPNVGARGGVGMGLTIHT